MSNATQAFSTWLTKQIPKKQLQVASRIKKIQLEGHFGTKKNKVDPIGSFTTTSC